MENVTPAADEKPLLRLTGISKSFPGVRALDNVDFELRPREVHAIMGENGAGKSTLMKILGGAYLMDAGTIEYMGEKVEIGNPAKAIKLGISLIAQELNIAGNMAVYQNVFMGHEIGSWGLLNRKDMIHRTSAALDRLGVDIDPERIASTLSTAEQQSVEIARALVHNSRVLIMDEPTAALSEKETERLFAVIEELKKDIGIVYISHRMQEIQLIADRVTVMRDGKYIGTLNKNEIEVDRIVSMMVGREITSDYYITGIHTEKIANRLVVRDMTDGKKIKNVSFQAMGGEILGFAGLVGSGRTELMRLIFGVDKKTSGKIWLDGKEVDISSPKQAINQGVGYMPEDRKLQGLFLDMSVQQNICANIYGQTAGYGLLLRNRKDAAISSESSRRLSIRTPSIRSRVSSLSGGNQQKTLLARWLAIQPRVLILDEPTRGVDVNAKQEIYRIIGNIAGHGVLVIVISSELPEVVGLAQRVLVMREGEIYANLFRPGEITQENIMQYGMGFKKMAPDEIFMLPAAESEKANV